MSALLTLTDNAVDAVKEIVSASDEASETSGLRMVAEQTGMETSLRLSVVPVPAEDDEVIEEEGVRVFLEPAAASLLDDKGARCPCRAGRGRVHDRGPGRGVAEDISRRGG